MSVGTAATSTLLPLVAVLNLHADSAQIGAIVAINLGCALLFQLPFSIWTDRRSDQVRLLSMSCLISAFCGMVIPALWLFGLLTFSLFIAALVLLAIISAFRSTLGHAVVNDLVPPGERVTAIGRVNGLFSGADIVGQSLGGGLVALLAAPLALLSQPATFLVSILFLRPIRHADRLAKEATSHSKAADTSLDGAAPPDNIGVMDCLKYLAGQYALWIAISIAFLGSLTEPVFALYALHTLRIPPPILGFLIALGAVGGIIGGFSSGFLEKRAGTHLTLSIAILLTAAGVLFPAIATPGANGIVSIILFELFTALGGTILMTLAFGIIQNETPRSVISKTMTVAQLLMQVIALAGVGLGVLVSQQFSYETNFFAYLYGCVLLLVMSVLYLLSRTFNFARFSDRNR